MIPVRASVLVKNPDHPRAGQAGVIVNHGTMTELADGAETSHACAGVHFDADQPHQDIEPVRFDDLRVLGLN